MKKAPAAKKTTVPRRTITAKKARAVKPPRKPADRLLQLVVRALDEKKAGDVRVYQVGRLSSITDYLVLATATSDPHLRALSVELEKVIDAEKVKILGIDTSQGSGWTVVDVFDVMVHLFTTENREKYRLDLLWKDAEEVPVSSLL
jgi:ribosome-associated protein